MGAQRASAAAVAVVALLAPAGARADGGAAGAQRLFEQARDLMAEGRYAEACSKLEGSEAQDPGIGTEFNLARCYELAGRLASARAMYRRVIDETHAAGQTDRETVARDLSAQLQGRVAHVALRVAAPPAALEIRFDGAPVPVPDWATPLESDPGAHEVEASAPGFAPWKSLVRVVHEGETVTLDVPPLVPRAALEPVAPIVTTLPATPPAAETPHTTGSQRVVALVLGVAGLAGLVPGTYFGVRAISLESQAGPLCNAGGCNQDGYDLRTSSRWNGDASTVSFAVSAGLLVAAGALWLTAPAGR